MSQQITKGKKKAITHTGITFRSKEKKRKTVFKAVLNSPYTLNWPEVSSEDQQIILKELCKILSAVSDYKKEKALYRRNLNRKKLKNSDSQKDVAKIIDTLSTMDVDCKSIKMEDPIMSIDDNKMATSSKLIHLPSPPSTLSCIVIGINDVTRRLEQTINSETKPNLKRKYTQELFDTFISTNPKDQLPYSSPIVKQPLRMIFVCKADISPQNLCAHLPIMSFMAKDVLLVPLPPGAEELIGNKLRIKRVSCIGVKMKTPEFDEIYQLVKDKVSPINAPWLTPIKLEVSKKRKVIEEDDIATTDDDFMKTTCNEYIPTQIKQLVTSAPIKSKVKLEKFD
ncbi:hypothetical protein F8M41_002133 [Gigaspora margarita]|uniref:Uncharacterized protein n=1 Tax=Gigaspora margarita TaxID=4874 RepID=A0A8H4AZ00_GIGMA|nr:hypothetical protein F8M41_002133 [Gigaspora margarita]